MELEKQVVSLELARKLKTLGVKQDSHHVHYFNENLKYFIILPNLGCDKSIETKYCSAFTVAELGEMLPSNDTNYSKDGNMWSCVYGKPMPEHIHATFEEIFADAMAKMLIYLIENKYVEVGKL